MESDASKLNFERNTFVKGDPDETFLRKLFFGAQFFEGNELAELTAAFLRSGGNPNATIAHTGSIAPHIPLLQGASALAVALQLGEESAVRLLLSGGANPNAKTQDGTPILHIAIQSRPWLAAELLDAGADPSVQSRQDSTLTCAAKEGLADVCDRLLKQGTDIHERDNGAISALSCAVLRRQLNVVFLFMIRGVGPKAIDEALPFAREMDEDIGPHGAALESALLAGKRIHQAHHRPPVSDQEIFEEMGLGGMAAAAAFADGWFEERSRGSRHDSRCGDLLRWLVFALPPCVKPGLFDLEIGMEYELIDKGSFAEAWAAIEALDLRLQLFRASAASIHMDGAHVALPPVSVAHKPRRM